MLLESFRRLGSGRYLPGGASCKRTVLAFAAALIFASCGGGGHKERLVDGNGFTFRAPDSWGEARRATMITVSPSKDSAELVGVSIFRLVNPYRPSLFGRVVPELDGVAEKLASELDGRVTARRTVRVAGLKGRQYELAYAREGLQLQQTITFVLEGRREYQLLCRHEAGKKLAACARIVETFRVT
jgi:hypothetical protein